MTADVRREQERRSAVIRRILRANTFVRIAVLVGAFAPLSLIVRELDARRTAREAKKRAAGAPAA